MEKLSCFFRIQTPSCFFVCPAMPIGIVFGFQKSLCFENPDTILILEFRRHLVVFQSSNAFIVFGFQKSSCFENTDAILFFQSSNAYLVFFSPAMPILFFFSPAMPILFLFLSSKAYTQVFQKSSCVENPDTILILEFRRNFVPKSDHNLILGIQTLLYRYIAFVIKTLSHLNFGIETLSCLCRVVISTKIHFICAAHSILTSSGFCYKSAIYSSAS